MIEFKTGEKFPLTKYLNQGELCVSIPVGDFFDALCCIDSPTAKEIQQFKTGRLTVSLFERSNIPFIIFDIGFSFDISLDATKVIQEKPDWMKNEANVVNMFLVDARTGILKASRMIGLPLDFCSAIRSIISEQLLQTDINTEAEISRINNSFTTDAMIKQATIKYTFQ